MSPHGIFEGRHQHSVKSWPANFVAALTGRKGFEIRRDDRSPPYRTGDLVLLREFEPIDGKGYTGRSALYLIGYVERSPCLPEGWCGFELLSPELAARVAFAVLSPTAQR